MLIRIWIGSLQQTQLGNNELQFSRDVAQQNYTNDLSNQKSGTAQNVFGNNQTAINTGVNNSQARLGNSMNNLAWQQGVTNDRFNNANAATGQKAQLNQ